MEHYQALETIYVIRGVLAQDAMNYFTIFSAYLIITYLVGDKLTNFQAYAVSLLYSVFCLGPIVGFYLAVIDLNTIDHGARAPQVEIPYLVPSIMLLSWLVSIIFMVNVRKRSKKGTEQS